ncbi:transcriptional regulator, partial [Salmonella enterica]|nr:transcriptional regulator [Salmonella enterica]
YYHTGIDDAIRLGDELRSQHLQDNPILLSMQVMFLSLKGKHELARKLTKEISTQEITGLIAVNLLYAEYCQNSERALPTIREFLESEQRIDNNPGLLPLVLVAHGEAIAEKMWNKFKSEDNIWFKRWKQDPRLIKLR